VIKFHYERQEGCTVQLVAEGSFKGAGGAGDEDLQAVLQSVRADDEWTEQYFLVFFLSGAKWFSTINKAENKVEICQGHFSFRMKRSQKFSTELGYLSVYKRRKSNHGKIYLGQNIEFLFFFLF